MSTKLLHQIHEQDQAELAERYNGEDRRQPRRVWAVEDLKPKLTEGEFEAARRAVRECILYFPGARENLDRVDMAWSDGSLASKIDAGHSLWGLRQGVSRRSTVRSAPNVVEWIVQLHTLQDIAAELSFWRNMGANRAPIPDTRPVRRIVHHVLITMAEYYAACDAGAESWRGRAA